MELILVKKIILEIPLSWFENPIDGFKNKKFIANFLIQLTKLNIPLYLHHVPFGADEAPRTPEKGTLIFSYHSHNFEEKNVWHLKEAPITPLFAIDATGHSGWSEVANSDIYHKYIDSLDIDGMKNIINHYRQIFNESGISKYPQPDIQEINLPEKYVFFPMQVQTDPVSQFNRLNIFEMLTEAASCAQYHQFYLLVKRHPFCNSLAVEKFLNQLVANNAYVKIVDLNIHYLIKNAHAIITVNSGVGIEALVDGASVYSSGASEWSKASNQLFSLEDIDKVFSENPEKMNEFQEKFLGFLLSEYWVDPDDLNTIDKKIHNCIKLFDENYGYDVDTNPSVLLTPIIQDLQGRLEHEVRENKLSTINIASLEDDNKRLESMMIDLKNNAIFQEKQIESLNVIIERKINEIIKLQNSLADNLKYTDDELSKTIGENLELQNIIVQLQGNKTSKL